MHVPVPNALGGKKVLGVLKVEEDLSNCWRGMLEYGQALGKVSVRVPPLPVVLDMKDERRVLGIQYNIHALRVTFVFNAFVDEGNEGVHAFHLKPLNFRAVVIHYNPLSHKLSNVKDVNKHTVDGARKKVEAFAAGHGDYNG